MNEKGFIATISVLMALFITALFFVSLQPLVMGRLSMNTMAEDFLLEKTSSRNGLERLYSVFQKDISSSVTTMDYLSDLGIRYTLSNKTAPVMTTINKSVASSEVFYVNNKTTLTIRLVGFNFNYRIYFNNVLIASANNSSGVTWNKVIAGPANYGNYKVVFTATATATVSYQEQSSRTISVIENSKKELLLIITNNVSSKIVTMKLKLVEEGLN